MSVVPMLVMAHAAISLAIETSSLSLVSPNVVDLVNSEAQLVPKRAPVTDYNNPRMSWLPIFRDWQVSRSRTKGACPKPRDGHNSLPVSAAYQKDQERFIERVTVSFLKMLRFSSFKRLHSNWNQIKKHKAEVDLKKTMERSKLGTAIFKAVKMSGSEPKFNPWLTRLLNDAKRIDMPKKIVDDAIAKALRGSSGVQVVFEGRLRSFFFMVDCLTESKLNVEQKVRKVLQDNGAVFYDTPGHVKWMFKKRGVVEFHAPLLEPEYTRLKTAIAHFQRWIYANPSPSQALVSEFLSNAETRALCEPIVPTSIPFDQLLDISCEFGAEDLNEINLPSAMSLGSTDLPFYTLKTKLENGGDVVDFCDNLPPIQTLQILCPLETFHKFHQAIKKWSCFGYSPYIYREGIMFMPEVSDYDSDAIWQSLDSEEDGGREVLTLIDKLKQVDDVTEVWHNIKNVEPWYGMRFESQHKQRE